ncbi:hypothetical protein PF008_g8942 [Phytophthora fragariae]|uniref:Retrotransposon gag domain-containing protein n=1 Tax=Phytophthora fragariae TaxID=53985 RepID=A0A6G0RYP6_9STRA|nr:hypothetical protein PF008_g8942 [Phytophthora fragariae]
MQLLERAVHVSMPRITQCPHWSSKQLLPGKVHRGRRLADGTDLVVSLALRASAALSADPTDRSLSLGDGRYVEWSASRDAYTQRRDDATTRRRDASCRLHQPVPECRARRPSKRLRPPQHARRVPVHKSPRQSQPQPQPQPLRPRRVARLAERVASALAVKLNPTQSQATSRTILTPMSTQTNVVNEVATATATAMIPGTMLVVTMVKLEMLAMPLMTQFPVAHRSTSLYRPANPTRSSTIASRQSSNCLGFRSQLIGAQLRDGHRWSDAVQCSILLTCLSDEAADVFNELWQATPGLTVDQGLASLTEKYSTKIGEAAIRDRIRQATRRADESYESYAQRLLTLADALPGSRCIETNAIAALEAFI